jgi:sugar lactone lactonase YvrE
VKIIKSLIGLSLLLLPVGSLQAQLVDKKIHNLAWGGEDGKTLYMTAQGTLYRMPLNISGIRPGGDNQKLTSQR